MSEETKNVQPAAADNSKAAANNAKKQANKNKKPSAFVRFFRWIGRKGKEIFSELKKVTWPTFPKVVKQTGVVLGVILVFLIFVTAVDLGLQELLKLVTNS